MKSKSIISTVCTSLMVTAVSAFMPERASGVDQWMFTDNTRDAITDGGWVFSVTADTVGKTLAVGLYKDCPGAVASLDFSGTVEDGYSIVKIGTGSSIFSTQPSVPVVQGISALTLPDTVTNIADNAFSVGKISGDLVIPASVEYVGTQAFAGNPFGGTLSFKGAPFCREAAFASVFESVAEWGTLTTIHYGMLGAMHITTNRFVIPNQITEIEDLAFWNTGFGDLMGILFGTVPPVDVIIGDGMTHIGSEVFTDVIGIGRVSLPSGSALTIGSGFFLGYKTGYQYWDCKIYYRDGYFNPPANNLYKSSQKIFSSYVLSEFAGDWNAHTVKGDIRDVAYGEYDSWKGFPIYTGEWVVGQYLYDWWFTDSGKTNISDGNFVFSVDADTANKTLTVKQCLTANAKAVLDFTGTVEGGYSFKTMGDGIGEIFEYYVWNDYPAGLVLPGTVTDIADSAFMCCPAMSGDLAIPDSVTAIGVMAFYDCAFDGTLTLGNSVAAIGDTAFGGIPFTGALVIPDSVVTIGDNAFSRCFFDGTLTLGNSVAAIGEFAFVDVPFTGSLVIPDSMVTIGGYAFYGCAFDGTLTLGGSLGTIGDYAFTGNLFTGQVSFPDSITTIGVFSFRDCLIEQISTPSSGVSFSTSMGLGAGPFSLMPSLTAVYYRGGCMANMGDILRQEEKKGHAYFYEGSPYVVSYVYEDYIDEWEAATGLADIRGGQEIWCARPINPAPTVGPVGGEEWVPVTKIEVLPNGNVNLTLDNAGLAAKLGSGYLYAVYSTTDLTTPFSAWADVFEENACAGLALNPRTDPMHVATLLGIAGADSIRFFKVKAKSAQP